LVITFASDKYRKKEKIRRAKMTRTISKSCTVLLLVTSFGMLLRAQTPAGPKLPAGVPDGYVITPFGYFHPSCVLHVAEGETVLADGRILQHADGTFENIPACQYLHYAASGEILNAGAAKIESPTINGWVEYASATISTSFGEIAANTVVPSAPTTIAGQILYFFPGLEDLHDVVSILQPVLQYGYNGRFGGNDWVIASWNCCPSGTADYSTPVSVTPGDVIEGTVKSTCSAGTESCSKWNITTTDQYTGKSTTLSNSPSEGQTFNWAFGGVLEAYNITQCSDYPAFSDNSPGSVSFEDIFVYNYDFGLISNPGWSVSYPVGSQTPQCGYSVLTATEAVSLFYKP
jgi:hypothetical protein